MFAWKHRKTNHRLHPFAALRAGSSAFCLHPLQRGQASVELVLILFIVVVLMFGAFSLGQGVAVKHALDVATEKAARLLSINPGDFGAADLLIRREVDASVLGGGYGSLVGISLADADTGAPITDSDLSNAGFGYRFLVQTEVPFLADVPFLALAARTITAAHYGLVDRVQP
jgi:hypothetical protein